MKNTILINGQTFELKKPIGYAPLISWRNLCDCYERPSLTKMEIYDAWADWFIELDSVDYGVKSYNCNFFTIEGIVTVNDKLFYLEITASHNRAYPIIEN